MTTHILIAATVLIPCHGLADTEAPPRERVVFSLLREDGTPIGTQVRAHLYNIDGEVGPSEGTLSDDTGAASFEALPCARYDLWIAESPDDATIPTAMLRGCEVRPGEGAQTIELTVPAAGGVTGKLVTADGTPPAEGAIVAVQSGTVPEEDSPAETWPAAFARGAMGCYAEAPVAADGSFTLTGLTVERHSLDVRLPGERDAWCSIPTVEVKAGGVTDVGAVEMPAEGWRYMFNRTTFKGWLESDFYGQKEVRIEGQRVVMTEGTDMTGITWDGEPPRIDYEVTLQAMRVLGSDFFSTLTFPVGEDYCSLVMGGWGGSVVGLSSLEGADASENETTQWIMFDNLRWYRIRLRVSQEAIEAWLDEKPIVDVALKDRRVGTRIEVDASKPFGISTWCTTGAVRDIRIRELD